MYGTGQCETMTTDNGCRTIIGPYVENHKELANFLSRHVRITFNPGMYIELN